MIQDKSTAMAHHGKDTPQLAAALGYATLGLHVLPVHSITPKGGCSCGKPDCSSPGKHPRTKHGVKDATTDENTIRKWWSMWPDANVAVRTGIVSGFFALDVDTGNGKIGEETLAAYEANRGKLPETVKAVTGSGGAHYLFRQPGFDVPNSAQKLLGPGLDIRGDNGYIVVDPSNHVSGGQYAWVPGHAPNETDVAEAPDWLLDILRSRPKPADNNGEAYTPSDKAVTIRAQNWARTALDVECETMRSTSEGHRNDQLNISAYKLGGKVHLLGESAIIASLQAAAGAAGLGEHEILPTISSGLAKGREKNGNQWPPNNVISITGNTKSAPAVATTPEKISVRTCLKNNEVGDAWLYRELHRDRLRFDHAAQRWFVWAGHSWAEDRTAKSLAAVDAVVAEYRAEYDKEARKAAELAETGDNAGKKAALDLAKQYLGRIRLLQTRKRRQNVLSLASSGEDSLGISGQEWDANPNLVGLANGVLELDTDKKHVTFRPGRQMDYIKTVAPTGWPGGYGVYKKPADLNDLVKANGPNWLKFLNDVFASNQGIIDHLQRLFGYALGGNPVERVLPIFWGKGANGKTTLLETIKDVLGPLAGASSVSIIMASGTTRGAGPRPDLLALRGQRLTWISESGEGSRLVSDMMKMVTGNDTLVCRGVYGKRQISFRPTHTLCLITNHRPKVDAYDQAI